MTEHHIPNAAVLSGWRKSSYSGPDGGSCLEVLDGWRKSSYSGSDGGDCLEVRDDHPTAVPVRDSKNPNGPAVVFPSAGWSSFVTALKRGEFPAA
ncbi:DUF397 domain-containing protein [Streptomyces odontomachi]|uniref:DUF397 domain-containing protein n=1 Tax=Streptomyces odontomachi TaxID=2944940 RepID=UPI00210B1E7C|nr:DUF397 domain-containing protein [Streptomyces sp. ODS25]